MKDVEDADARQEEKRSTAGKINGCSAGGCAEGRCDSKGNT